MQPAATIYLATNVVNGKQYVGVTRFTIAKRWSEHRTRANMGVKSRFASAIRKHGADRFTVEPIASCLSIEAASEVERSIIKQIAPEYNQTNGGEITVGRKVTPEVAARISAGNQGKKRTPEDIARNSAQAKKRWAENPEWAARIRAAAAKGRANIDRAKQKAASAAAARKRVWTDEARAKLSASCMGRRHTPEVLARIAAKKTKKVICTTTGDCFQSCEEVSEILHFSTSSLYKVLAGARPSVGGMHFQYREGDVS